MMDVSAIAGLVSSLQAAGEIAKAMIGLRDTALVQSKMIELQGVILTAQSGALSAQQDQFSALDRIRALEGEVANLEEWNAEKQKYKLTEVGSGVFAYALKTETDSPAPSHHACPNCYEQRHISILQHEQRPFRRKVLACLRCGSVLWPEGGSDDSEPDNRPKVQRGGTWGRGGR